MRAVGAGFEAEQHLSSAGNAIHRRSDTIGRARSFLGGATREEGNEGMLGDAVIEAVWVGCWAMQHEPDLCLSSAGNHRPAAERAFPRRITPLLGGASPFLGGEMPSVGSTTSSIGGATPFLGGATSFMGEATSSLGRRTASIGGDTPFLGGAKPSIGEESPSLGETKSSIGGATSAERCHPPTEQQHPAQKNKGDGKTT